MLYIYPFTEFLLFLPKKQFHNAKSQCTNICIIGVPEGEEREKGPENISENIVAENFPNLGKETVTQVQEAQGPIQDEPKEEHTKTRCN